MYSARVYVPERPALCGSSFDLEEVCLPRASSSGELERLTALTSFLSMPTIGPCSAHSAHLHHTHHTYTTLIKVRELEALDRASVAAIAQIVDPASTVHAELQQQGRRWAAHQP